ncbi:MAG: ATPase [Elusimicrobia bacterium]|nr:ATPase [Elusimicrobiota bacterium]
MSEVLGLDIGSSYTKAVLVSEGGAFKACAVVKTGMDFALACRRAVRRCAGAASGAGDLRVFSTGVGRAACPSARAQTTEITCLARGSFAHFPKPHTVVDIGGQDNKVVRVDACGRVASFKMNRKCAAGTGAFLEEIARRLDVPVSRMSRLAASADSTVEIGSYCTVFTCTEIIHHVREGRKAAAILRGCYDSVVRRILEIDALEGDVVLSGGVAANHPVVAELFQERLPKPPIVPERPQWVGALGAALLGIGKSGGGTIG